jgi:hypothetical protein
MSPPLGVKGGLARADKEIARFTKAFRKKSMDLSEKAMRRMVQVFALEMLRGVVLLTPVDTGRARGAWTVTIAFPSETIPSKGSGDKIGGLTINRGRKVINRYRLSEILWLTNNVPYIVALEGGHSRKQAPRGMLALTVQRVRRSLR